MSKTSRMQKVNCLVQWLNSKDAPKIKKKVQPETQTIAVRTRNE